MDTAITFTELNKTQVDQLFTDTIYSQFMPVKCTRCESKNGFNRRIFQIKGVPEDKHADEDTQNLLRHHFFQEYKIEHVFFWKSDENFYVDSANCQSCQSTAIVYDITKETAKLWSKLVLKERNDMP